MRQWGSLAADELCGLAKFLALAEPPWHSLSTPCLVHSALGLYSWPPFSTTSEGVWRWGVTDPTLCRPPAQHLCLPPQST